MDPTSKKHPKPTSSATAATKTHRRHHHHHHPQPLPIHPLPDPTILPPSTIQNISHRFSKLYANHKKLASSDPTKPPAGRLSQPHPEPEPCFQTKNLVSDNSSTTLTKSNSQHERNKINNLGAAKIVGKDQFLIPKTKVKETDDSKKPSSKKALEKPSFDEFDLKKGSQLMSKSMESEEVERCREGFEVRRLSVSSIPPSMVGGGGGGRRRSFCSSQVELADFFSCNGVKVVAVDMPPFMQIHAVDCARKTHDSMEKFTSKTLAFTLKKEFDGIYGPAWHCIVGTSFGSFVTHSVGGFMYFSMDHKLYILLFKTTVQRAAG